tara:strand:- start:309 stop:2717 length:2409 start_codon:yes stop_codon:yes gene_type:complete
MSFIVTTSKQDKYGLVGETGIENPASFNNYLSNAMIVEPNSEIAVQSVKIHRTPNYTFRKNNKGFYLAFYPGTYTLKTSWDAFMPNFTLIRIFADDGTYTPKELCVMLSNKITDALAQHPEVDTAVMSVEFTAQAITNYKFTVNIKSTDAQNSKGRESIYPLPPLDSVNLLKRYRKSKNPVTREDGSVLDEFRNQPKNLTIPMAQNDTTNGVFWLTGAQGLTNAIDDPERVPMKAGIYPSPVNATKNGGADADPGDLWDAAKYAFTGKSIKYPADIVTGAEGADVSKDEQHVVVFPQENISLQGGVLKVNIEANTTGTGGAVSNWSVGLTRPTAVAGSIRAGGTKTKSTLNNGNTDRFAPYNNMGMNKISGREDLCCPNSNQDDGGTWKAFREEQFFNFVDYSVASVKATENEVGQSGVNLGNYYLRCYYYGNGGMRWNFERQAWIHIQNQAGIYEVMYWDNTATALKGGSPYDIGGNADKYDSVQLKCSGDTVSVSVFVGAAESTVIDYDTDIKYVFPPINPNKYFMVPKMSLACETGRELVIEEYISSGTVSADGILNTNINHMTYGNNVPSKNKTVLQSINTATAGKFSRGNFYVYNSSGDSRGLSQSTRDIDLNWMNDPLAILPEYSTTLKYVQHPDIDTFNFLFLLEPTPNWAPANILRGGEPNMMDIFGFDIELLYDGNQTAGAGQIRTWTSQKIGPIEPEESLFIQCPTFTQTSFNFGTSSQSKILYHLPQFANDGQGSGPLFFEPNERVYVAMNNPEELSFNQIQTNIVSRNEIITKELSGVTVVCYHIRKRGY